MTAALTSTGPATATRTLAASERSRLVADVGRAGSIVAPYWPLTGFVAVNPLGGLTDLHVDEASAAARRWFGARTHLSLDAYRAEHARGAITDADLDRAIQRRVPDLDAAPAVSTSGRAVSMTEVIRWDLLHGPTDAPVVAHDDDTLAAALDDLLTRWCAAFVDEAHVPWQMPDRQAGFYGAWRALATGDRRLGSLIGRRTRALVAELPDTPAEMLDLALRARGVDDAGRVDAIRTWLLRTPGWAGFARWCDDWAPPDHPGVRLRMIDLAAVRAAMDHLAPEHLDLRAPDVHASPDLLDRRVAAAVAAFVPASGVDLTAALAAVPEADRQAIFLDAHEWHFRDRLLARLSPSPTAGAVHPTRAAAQLVFCIDVRSEGLRRHLESLGAYDTYGFAGFFGVPVRWRPIGSDVAQARCPVLVSPRHEVTEVALDDDHRYLAGRSAASGLHDAFHAAKGGIASPFTLAESAGWFAGPAAAKRTFAPASAPIPTADGAATTPSWWRRRGAAPNSVPIVDDDDARAPRSGLSLEERTLFAEAIVTTIGMTDFAPLVVFCGHASETTNNPHASSLDCGACGGAPGGASARIAAAILNEIEVRAGLRERGIDIPDDTWFVAGEHDTTADIVTILDPHLLPDTSRSKADTLRRDLATAGARNALDRAARLPGGAARVRDRGHDWAQVRPEWGLAGNASFIIGPRSITAAHDLGSRAFLHSYVAERDPDGVALETIMTAPLVVGQWISAQYYYSTVEPDLFGAGDKMLHNPVGGIGVVVGESGDLAVGLPMQSVMLGDQRAHDPLRMLAVIQAPLDRIEEIISRNRGLRELVEGEWIHVVARENGHDAWSFRSPTGGWEPWSPAPDPRHHHLELLATTDLSIPLEIS